MNIEKVFNFYSGITASTKTANFKYYISRRGINPFQVAIDHKSLGGWMSAVALKKTWAVENTIKHISYALLKDRL